MRGRSSKLSSKILCGVMSIALCMGTLPLQAIAFGLDAQASGGEDVTLLRVSQVVEGSYQFTSTKDSNRQSTDSFVYRDDCFERSSFEGCSHLPELSAQLTLASASWFGEGEDPTETNVGETDHNISAMLSSMGFSDVEVNGYYRSESLPNSMAVAVAHRTIVQDNEACTLLVVVPRGSGYKREFIGNATVGDGNIHQGFKEARDEVLRFVRSYVQEHRLTGRLKLWTAGHSRGGAVANLVAGFFAVGGSAYLGNTSTIAPEDIYCYTYAAPAAIKAGTTTDEILSVSAARGGLYHMDTPGEEYSSLGGGAVDLADKATFGGIHNYTSEYDLVPLLPPSAWGFGLFGVDCDTGDGLVGIDEMEAELAGLSSTVYGRFQAGDPRDFEWVIVDPLSVDLGNLDPQSLSFRKAEGMGDGSIKESYARRVAGLTTNMPSNAAYVSAEYQNVLESVCALYALVDAKVLPGGAAGIASLIDKEEILKCSAISYLAYASHRLQLEERAHSDAEAVLIVLNELISYLASAEVQVNNVDSLVEITSKIVADNSDSALVSSLLDLASQKIPDDYLTITLAFVKQFVPGFSAQIESASEFTDEEALEELGAELVANSSDPRADLKDALPYFISALCYGPARGSLASIYFQDAKAVRKTAYSLLVSYGIPAEAIGRDEGSNLDGSASAVGLIEVILQKLLEVRDASGTVVSKFESLEDLSNVMVVQLIQSISDPLTAAATQAYGGAYAAEIAGYLKQLASHPFQTKSIICDTLFTVEGQPFSTMYNMVVLSTMIKYIGVPYANHHGEVYLSWERAASDQLPKHGTNAMYRLYNPNSGEHFYTANVAERDNVVAAGWTYEGVGWTASEFSSTPVYRLYNANGGEHHYTTDAAERDNLVNAGWNDEGIGWYSDDAKGVKLLREYNPNQFACNHNYTSDEEEHKNLVALGWHDEGVAWYGLASLK